MKTPAVFQRFMEQSCQDDKGHFIVPYPDDVLKISPTDPTKIKKIWCWNQSKKGQFFRRQVLYLGSIIAEGGYRLDPNNIREVKDLVRQNPKVSGDLRRLLEMIGYFRKYIRNFSKTAEPLYVLLKITDGQSNSLKILISWSETQQEALHQLLLCLVAYLAYLPILTYPDYNKDFVNMLTLQIKV